MYKLRVKVTKAKWKDGIRTYVTYDEAIKRQKELRALKIESKIIKF